MQFNQLWEQCEALNLDTSVINVINELNIKLKLYEKINILPNTEEAKEAKTYLLGEILMHLTSISKIDDIDVSLALMKVFINKSQG